MTATRTAPAEQVSFFRNPVTDAVFAGCATGPCTIGHDLYAVKAERVGSGWRCEFLKIGGGESVVRATSAAHHCTCKGFYFSKDRTCRHVRAFHLIEADLAADERETVTDADAVADEMSSYYGGFNWE